MKCGSAFKCSQKVFVFFFFHQFTKWKVSKQGKSQTTFCSQKESYNVLFYTFLLCYFCLLYRNALGIFSHLKSTQVSTGCILDKMGTERTSGNFDDTWLDAGTVFWLRQMMFHKNTRTHVHTSWADLNIIEFATWGGWGFEEACIWKISVISFPRCLEQLSKKALKRLCKVTENWWYVEA